MNPIKTNNAGSNKSDSMFYLLAAAGVAGVLGGIYYLWNTFAEEEIDEQEMIEIEDIKEEIKKKDGMNTDTAIRVLYLTNHHAEEELKRSRPDIDKKRREAINNEEEYKALCMEYMEAKEYCYQRASQRILQEFGTSMEEIQKFVQMVDPATLEKKFFEFEKPDFEGGMPDKDKVKTAFKYFANKFIEEMQGMSAQFKSMSYSPNPEVQQMLMFNLFINKLKVEDMLFIKYDLTEQKVRYLLNHYNLSTDPEIMQLHSRIGAFEEMLG